MGFIDSIKNILIVPSEDEYDDEYEEVVEKEEPKKKPLYQEPVKRSEPSARVLGGGKSKTVSFNPAQMQVVLVKPERYEDVTSIADHLNDGKTVVLNLESADRDVSRRIVDFLSGVAYATGGNMRKVAKNTFIIVARGVDVMGELLPEEFEDGKMYF